MRWTGAEIDDPVDAFVKINRARNWEEFSTAVREFTVPGQNFVYCDTRGNIGYRCGLRLPLRGKQSSLLPLPGWEKSSEWKGFVPPEQLPFLYNPPEGYVASANNKVADDSYPYHISDLWEPPSRIQRLREVLGKANDVFTVMDCERLQNDAVSVHAMEILPYVFSVCRDTAFTFPGKERVVEYFRNWNFSFARDDIATSIYQAFLVRLLENTFEDELGSDLFHDYVVLSNIPVRVITKLLQEGTSDWFDDRTTPEVETREDIVRRSLRDGVEMLRSRLGPEMKGWRWGELHSVTLKHPFGLVHPLDRIFNLGPFPVGGGTTALISGEYSFTAPFEVTVGPSFRQVFDMADPQESRAVLPSGQSGQVFSGHYGDQTELWLSGAYRIVRADEREGHWDRLHLEPAR
jgi:penicillin amidase